MTITTEPTDDEAAATASAVAARLAAMTHEQLLEVVSTALAHTPAVPRRGDAGRAEARKRFGEPAGSQQ